VPFEDAAIRAAQLTFNLKYDDAAGRVRGFGAFFSWQSRGESALYPADEATIEASEQQLEDFVLEMARRAGDGRLHIVVPPPFPSRDLGIEVVQVAAPRDLFGLGHSVYAEFIPVLEGMRALLRGEPGSAIYRRKVEPAPGAADQPDFVLQLAPVSGQR